MQNKCSEKLLKDIFQWDIKNWSNVLPFWEEHFEFKKGMKVLALGEREGGMSLYFALKGANVICSDYRDFPKETKEFHKSYGVSSVIEYSKVDMRNIQFEDEEFDVVVFKSVLGALGDSDSQEEAMTEIFRVLKKGGKFLFAENLEGSILHKFLRKKFIGWAQNWRYISDKEMRIWLKDYKAINFKSYGVFALFGRSENQRNFLGRIDSWLSFITPKKWRYILFGVLTK